MKREEKDLLGLKLHETAHDGIDLAYQVIEKLCADESIPTLVRVDLFLSTANLLSAKIRYSKYIYDLKQLL